MIAELFDLEYQSAHVWSLLERDSMYQIGIGHFQTLILYKQNRENKHLRRHW